MEGPSKAVVLASRTVKRILLLPRFSSQRGGTGLSYHSYSTTTFYPLVLRCGGEVGFSQSIYVGATKQAGGRQLSEAVEHLRSLESSQSGLEGEW